MGWASHRLLSRGVQSKLSTATVLEEVRQWATCEGCLVCRNARDRQLLQSNGLPSRADGGMTKVTNLREAARRQVTPVSGLAILLCLSCSSDERAYVEVQSIGASEERTANREDAGTLTIGNREPVASTSNSPTDAGSTNRGVNSEGQSDLPLDCAADGSACGPDAGVEDSMCSGAADCEPTCPGCAIEGECIALGLLNPENNCQICDPSRSLNQRA